MSWRSVVLLYLAVGALVAGGLIGGDRSLFADLDDGEQVAELVLTVVLWPVVLLGGDIHIGEIDIGAPERGDGKAVPQGGESDGRIDGRGGDVDAVIK
jgi:hypothetical protein